MATVVTSVDVSFAPGMRVEVRDAEWRIQRVDHSSDGGQVLSCQGLSELVQGREALFLTRLETVRVLAPETTALVADDSSNFDASLLYIDSLRRQRLPSDEFIRIGHQGALDRLDYQLEPALQALAQPRQRILMADAVGLGKTLEAGILTSELIARGRGRRILVLAIKSMLGQFQQEFWNRFTIPLVRLDSVGLQRVRRTIPTNHNPFHYFDRAIISIDTLKQDLEYRHHLEQAWWDIIIIDEAHNVADRGSHSQRARLAKLLSTRSDTLIMLSATPHDGKPESFASLMNMLDPTAIANPHDYASEDFGDKGLVIRRFKKDVRHQLAGSFPERVVHKRSIQASLPEEVAYERLMEVSFHTLDGSGGVGQLFRTTLEKALFSSPAACLSTVNNRIAKLERRLQRERNEEMQTALIEDVDTLQALGSALQAIGPDQFSKYQLLLEQLKTDLGWNPDDPEDRLVLFTESLATLGFLEEHLPRDLKLRSGAVAVLRGDSPDRELMETVDAFNRRESSIRLLLCSDVAAEGINLHHMAHRMVHFDIPWSLMVFQQRNGRIDRYGQTRQPQISYLLTESANERVRGDQRVLEILIDKDEQASKNIGDPSEFLGLYDQEAEEEKVAEAIEQGTDLLAQFLALADDPVQAFVPSQPVDVVGDRIRLMQGVFPDGLSWAGAAVRWLHERGEKIDAKIEDDLLVLAAPPSLRPRLDFLPPEARPEHDRFVLSPNVARISQAIRDSRHGEDAAWPSVQYLWLLHPVMQWLTDRVLHAFGRHTAPVLHLPGKLAADEHIVLLHGGFPNRRGHVLIQDWVGVHFVGDTAQAKLLDWKELIARLELKPRSLPNRGHASDVAFLGSLLPAAIKRTRQQLDAARNSYIATHAETSAARRQQLDTLRQHHQQQLDLQFTSSQQPEAFKRQRHDAGQTELDRVFNDYQNWLDDTQTTEPDPYIQVIAVFTGQSGTEAAP